MAWRSQPAPVVDQPEVEAVGNDRLTLVVALPVVEVLEGEVVVRVGDSQEVSFLLAADAVPRQGTLRGCAKT